MSAESSFKLVVNGKITPEGKLARGLILSDPLLRNNTDPSVNFAMSSDMVEKHTKRRIDNMQTLGISEEDAIEMIPRLEMELNSHEEFMTHRMLPEDINKHELSTAGESSRTR